MKKILLVCNAGMSTSLLVTRMEKVAKEKNIEVVVEAVPFIQAETDFENWDVVLLGPQIRYQLKSLEKKVKGQIPIQVIDIRDYGLMNSENILLTALTLIDNFKK